MKRPADAAEEPAAKTTKLAAGTKLKLIYFDLGGKGDPLRLALKYAGLEFEDKRLPLSDFTEFMAMKESGELAFGQVPALVVTPDGGKATTLVQTGAIIRFIAKSAPASGLYPEDTLLASHVDAMVDQATDMMCCILCAKYQSRFGFEEALGGPEGEGTKKAEKAIQTSVMPRHLGFFESILENSRSGWLCGTPDPTIADFILGTTFKQLSGNAMVNGSELLPKYPKIQEFVERFHALPAVKAWYSDHK